MKNRFVWIVVVAVVLVVLGLIAKSLFQPAHQMTPQEKAATSFETCIAQGFLLIDGVQRQCRTTDGRTFLEPEAPTASGSTKSSVSSQANITVLVPKPNEKVAKIFLVKGQARTFENVVSYRLKDEDGKVITEAFTTAAAADVGQFGSYSATIDSSSAKGTKGTIEVFENSAKDGSEVNKVTVPVVFTK